MDMESVRARVVDAYEQGPDAVVELVGTLMGELVAHLETVSARVTVLEGENATLRARLDTNSRNSGRPPSSDGPGVKPHPKSQRVPRGRQPGGQPGHAGHSLRLADEPDEVQVHAPSHCHVCGQSLDDLPALRWERRQVIDIPPVRARIIEHQAATTCCPGCGTTTSGTFPPGVAAPVQYGPGVVTLAVYLTQEQLLPLARTSAVLAEVFGCAVSEATVERAVADCHERLAEAEAAIKQGVIEAAVAHFDETGVNVGGTTAWLHVASTPRLTFYAVHKKRGRAALDAIGVVPQFGGRAVHDGWTSYWQYSQCAHALCNAHHLRELTFVEEQLGQSWAKDLKGLLGEIKHEVDDARGRGRAGLPADVQRAFAQRYDAVLEEGLAANPPPPPTGQRGRPKRGKAGSLVDRLREHKGATLAFMEDLTIPFDNNQAERDIRMTKVREKISGCFRTTTGAERFCRIRGYISTLRKQGLPILSALSQAILGTPPIPLTTGPRGPG
ncbi:MAG: IS66 family transposase [Chloroflexi bacterium]|nr:IS66 family transposase [Chloroflexota bacterium]